MNNKLTSIYDLIITGRSADRSAEIFLELKNPNRHIGSLEAKFTPFRKLLSFAVFYVKVRTQCRLPSVCKNWFISRQRAMSNADPGNFKKQFLCIGSPVRKVFKLLIYTQTSNMWHIFVEQYSMYYPNYELNRNQKQTGCFQLTEKVVISVVI